MLYFLSDFTLIEISILKVGRSYPWLEEPISFDKVCFLPIQFIGAISEQLSTAVPNLKII